MPSILCIDDNTESLGIRKAMLEMLGHSVLIADNGASGLRLLAGNPVDVVILDYHMPQMDGLAVARAIRARYGKLPIVLLSGYPMIPPALSEIVDASVGKDQVPQVLLEEIRRVTDQAKKRPETNLGAREATSQQRTIAQGES